MAPSQAQSKNNTSNLDVKAYALGGCTLFYYPTINLNITTALMERGESSALLFQNTEITFTQRSQNLIPSELSGDYFNLLVRNGMTAQNRTSGDLLNYGFYLNNVVTNDNNAVIYKPTNGLWGKKYFR